MIARLAAFGFYHGDWPSELRNRLCATDARVAAMLRDLGRTTDERMIVSTCERFEVYAITDAPHADTVSDRLAHWFDLPAADVARRLRTLRDRTAAEHLLRVASGFESRIVGEPHVLGQVRLAYLKAARAGATGPMLDALARAAIHTGKRVRSETGLNASRRSIVTVVMEHLDARLGSVVGRDVIVLGTGNLARDLVSSLSARGAARLTVASRDPARATRVAGRVGGAAVDIAGLPPRLADCDAVVACTQAPEPVIRAAMIRRKPGKPLVVVDLGVPHNVEPGAATLANVSMCCLDDLLRGEAAGGEHQPATRIIQVELARYLRWVSSRRILAESDEVACEAAA